MNYIYICQERRKDRKTRKSRREEKVMGFTSASLFPVRKRDEVTQDETRGLIEYPTRRRTQGAGIIKGWNGKEDRWRIPDTFT